MSSHPIARSALGAFALWTAIIANSLVALATPVDGWAVIHTYEGLGRETLGQTLFRPLVTAFVLVGLYLVVGYWRVGLGRTTRSSEPRLWALSLSFNVVLLTLAVFGGGPYWLVAAWALAMVGLSGYELFRDWRAGPLNQAL